MTASLNAGYWIDESEDMYKLIYRVMDMLGVGAYDGDRLVGLAGASADCETMWQIGVDVLPAWRGKGIGSGLVGVLKEKILEKGKIPFYSTSQTHIASMNTALKAGFLPAWTEIFAK